MKKQTASLTFQHLYENGEHQKILSSDLLVPESFAHAFEADFFKGICLIQTQRWQELDILLNNSTHSHQDLFTKILPALKLKKVGHSAQALQLVHSLSLLQLHKNISPVVLAEIYLQLGSVYFANSEFLMALELYQQAYEHFAKISWIGKKAISAFNCFVACDNLKQSIEADQWLLETETLLKNHSLVPLENSVLVSQIEKMVFTGQLTSAINRYENILSENLLSRLNPRQNILIHQAIATAYMELGYLNLAENSLRVARENIFQFQHLDLEIFQMALELNFESISLRKIVKPKSFHTVKLNQDIRGELKKNIATFRKNNYFQWTQFEQKKSIFLKSLQNKYADLYTRWDLQDLKDLHELDLYSASPRALQTALLSILTAKKKNQLKDWLLKATNLQVEYQGPWQKTLLGLAQSFLFCMDGLPLKAKPIILENLSITEANGLEIIHGLLLGLLSWIDNHHQMQWLDYVLILDTDKKKFFEDFFKATLGISIIQNRWLVDQEQLQILTTPTTAGFVSNDYDLLIDKVQGKIFYKSELVPIKYGSVMSQILIAILSSKSEGLEKSEIATVMGIMDYNPITNDPAIYSNIRRLREIIPIECMGSRYRLSPDTKWGCIEDRPLIHQDINEREQTLLRLIEQYQQAISAKNGKHSLKEFRLTRQQAVEQLGVSERTALRVLTDLVNKGLLQKFGAGRGVYYKKTN